MQYNQPFDQPTVPNASYVNGNPAIGLNGSIPPAECFQFPQQELVFFFLRNNLTPTNADLFQLCRAFQDAQVNYAVDTGTANAINVVLNPPPNARVPGLTLRIRKMSAPNGGAMTINDGLGITDLVKFDGASLNGNDLPGSALFECVWDGSRYQLTNFLGAQSSTQTVINNYSFSVPYCVDTSVTSNTITAPFSPAITSVSAGKLVLVKLARAFTGGAVSIFVNALPQIAVKRGDGSNPLIGDGSVNQVLLLEYDGANFQIVNCATPSKPLPIMIGDVKPFGSQGGTCNPLSFNTRDLNTVLGDPFGLVGLGLISISSNRVTIGAGKWIVHSRIPIGECRECSYRMWNVTDNVLAIKAEHQSGVAFCGVQTEFVYLDGEIDLTAPKTFEIQGCHMSQATGLMGGTTSGGVPGTSTNFGTSNQGFIGNTGQFWTDDQGSEIFTILWLTKVS